MSLSGLLNLDDTLGAVYIGYSVSSVIFGIFTMQTISYFVHYRADPWSLKVLVILIWFIELFHQLLISHALYHYCISLFGSPLAVINDPLPWSFVAQLPVGVMSGVLVKAWFVIRIWKFSAHNIIVTGFLAVTVVAQMGSSIAYTVEEVKVKNVVELGEIKGVASAGLAMVAAADVLTATALWYYLRKWRTGHEEADSLLNNLVRYAFSTGAATSVMSILTLILYDVRTSTFQYMATYLVLSKMFAVSFMCALGTRKRVQGHVVEEFLEIHEAIHELGPRKPTRLISFQSISVRNGVEPYMVQAPTQLPALKAGTWRLPVRQPTLPSYAY